MSTIVTTVSDYVLLVFRYSACRKGDRSHGDYDEDGFLPGYSEYPREKVIEYLEGNENGELTPALAERYGDLTDRYEVIQSGE
jgi:hypothetical protein